MQRLSTVSLPCLTLAAAALLSAGFTSNANASSFAAKPDKLEKARQKGAEVLLNRLGATANRSARANDLREKRTFLDDGGKAHFHAVQTVDDVPVFGGEAIVHFDVNDEPETVTDAFLPNVQVAATVPSFDTAIAAELAAQAYNCGDCLTAQPEVDLFVLRRGKKDRLVYRVQLRREDGSADTAMPVYFIDANSGKLVWQYDNLQTASGSSLYSGSPTFNTYLSGSTYYLEDITRKVGTFDSRNTETSVYRFTDTDNVWNSAPQRAAVDAHYGAARVYDYFKNTHGRNGINGSGGPAYYTSADGVTGLISSKVHYSTNYNNAFWNGQFMTYGDGDGSQFSPLVTIDIAGHEITHGVTQFTANLTYANESGALNEAVSDIFGAMVERYTKGESSNTWKIGEQAYTPATAGDALRYMDTPTLGDQPDHYSERYTGTGDNGGVHINSGIANKQFHLLAKGGTHRLGGSMTGIGADKAARIWYRALTVYMTSSTNFRGARTATLNAAAAIYGSSSAEYAAVARSWTLCGVS